MNIIIHKCLHFGLPLPFKIVNWNFIFLMMRKCILKYSLRGNNVALIPIFLLRTFTNKQNIQKNYFRQENQQRSKIYLVWIWPYSECLQKSYSSSESCNRNKCCLIHPCNIKKDIVHISLFSFSIDQFTMVLRTEAVDQRWFTQVKSN